MAASRSLKRAAVPKITWTSGVVPLNNDLVATLRSEYLQLLRALSLTTSYDEARRVVDALGVWLNKFADLFFKKLIDDQMHQVIRSAPIVGAPASGPMAPLFRDRIDQWAKYWSEKLRTPLWNVKIKTFFLRRSEGPYATKPAIFEAWKKELPRELASAKRHALAAWKVLEEFIRWFGSAPQAVDVGVTENVTFGPFNVKIVGLESDVRQYIPTFIAGLRLLEDRARRIYPPMLKNAIPLEIHFDCKLDQGGEYRRKTDAAPAHAIVCAGSRSPKEYAHIIAHEFAHHIFKMLPKAAQNFWEHAIRSDYGEMDLTKTLACWERIGSQKSLWDFLDYLRVHDPINYLRFDTLVHSEHRPETAALPSIRNIDSLREAAQIKPRIAAVKNPITVYAHKNEEESFTEALSYLIVYGPRSVLPTVRGWLHMVLPELRSS